MYLLRILFEGL